MTKRRTICHIITGLGVGGAERALYNVLSGGLADQCQSHVISLSDLGRYGALLVEQGVQVHCLQMVRSKPWTIARLNSLPKLIGRIDPFLIQGWMYHGNIAAWHCHRSLPRKPRLAWNIRHSLYDPRLEPIQTRIVIEAGKHLSSVPNSVLYNSQRSRELHERWGYSAQRGHVIPNGFDLNAYYPDTRQRAALRAQLGIPSDSFVFGHFARTNPVKDHTNFILAALNVVAQHPNCVFLLAGTGVTLETTPFSSIPAAVRDKFVLLGERADVADLMRSLDAFVLSSWSEGFPNVLGEAMASGVPCIATDVGDCAYIVGDTGLLTPPRDHAALAAAMQTMVKNPEQVRTWSSMARERVSANFSLPSVVKQYAALYNDEPA